MRLRHVEIFHAIMQVGTIKGAARTLGTSQSRVISVLQHFEIQLGWNLFERQSGKLQPTPEARRLYQAMEPMVAQMNVVRRVAAAFSERSVGTVRIVATPSVAGALLPGAISRWHQRFPALRCAVATWHTSDIVTRLLLGEADIGLSLQNPHNPGIDAAVLASQPMVAVAPPRTWTQAQCALPLPLAELRGRLVGLTASDPLGALVHNALEAHDVKVTCVTVAQTHQLAVSLVAAGHGVALVDPFTAATAPAHLQARVCHPALPVELFSLTPKDAAFSPAAASLIEEITHAARACRTR